MTNDRLGHSMRFYDDSKMSHFSICRTKGDKIYVDIWKNDQKIKIRFKYNAWLPKLLRVGATMMGWGYTIRCAKGYVSRQLVKHELIHIWERHWKGFFSFYYDYIRTYFRDGMKYKEIDSEELAYGHDEEHEDNILPSHFISALEYIMGVEESRSNGAG